MRLVGFEPAAPVSEWPQTCALDGAAAEIGHVDFFQAYFTAESCSSQFTILPKVDIR